MKLQHLGYNIYHLSDYLGFELSFTLFRIQEFYESPSKRIRGQYFTLEEAIEQSARRQKDTHTDDYSFSWFDDNGGFNIPGNYVRNFFKKFKHDLLKRENRLYNMLKPVLRNNERFYLIGSYNYDSLHHEIAHALYYLSPEYKKEMNKLMRKLKYKKAMKKKLVYYDYCNNENILNDEVQAYMTETKPDLIESIGFKISWPFTTDFSDTLEKYVQEYNIKTFANIT